MNILFYIFFLYESRNSALKFSLYRIVNNVDFGVNSIFWSISPDTVSVRLWISEWNVERRIAHNLRILISTFKSWIPYFFENTTSRTEEKQHLTSNRKCFLIAGGVSWLALFRVDKNEDWDKMTWNETLTMKLTWGIWFANYDLKDIEIFTKINVFNCDIESHCKSEDWDKNLVKNELLLHRNCH